MLRTDSEHAMLSTAVCQARTEETILEYSPKYSAARMGATDVANRLVEEQIRTKRGRLEQVPKIEINITDPIVPWVVRHASWLLNQVRVKLNDNSPYRAIKGRPYGREAVELGEQVYWKVPGLTQQKFEDCWRPGAWLVKAWKSAEGASWQTPTECTLPDPHNVDMCSNVKELVGTTWEMMPKKTKLMSRSSLADTSRCEWCRNTVPTLDANRVPFCLEDTRMRVERGVTRGEADEDTIKATAVAEKDARQASSSATTTVNLSVAQPASGTPTRSSQPGHQGNSSSAADTTTSAAAEQAAAPVHKQKCIVGCSCRRLSRATPA